MLTFARSFMRQVRILFSRTLDLSPRDLSHPVQFSSGPDGLVIRAQVAGRAAQYQETTPRPPCDLVTSFSLLKAVEGTKAAPVTLIATDDGQITARWVEGPIPRVFAEPPSMIASELEFPSLPSRWTENPPELWPALAAAQGTTDPESSRYALGCIQLRGSSGVLAATDGSQLFRQSGFQFGWEDEVLIPGSKLFASHELPTDQPVGVGQLDKAVVLRSGKWTFWLPTQEGRFPRVDDVVPSPAQTNTTLSLAPPPESTLTTGAFAVHRFAYGLN